MNIKDFVKGWDRTLADMKKVMGAESVPFNTKATMAIDAIEMALDALCKLELVNTLDIEIEAHTEGKKVITWHFTLGEGIDDEGEDVYYLKRSKNEADE